MDISNQIKYTFLLPAYKAVFFEKALKSIQQQTYKDFKVLISDDASPEDLKSIFDKFEDDSRFIYRKNDKNMGSISLVSHWNLLVDICDTDFLILASDDDIYEPTFLEEIDKLQAKYTEVDLIHTRAQVIDEKDEVIKKDAIYEERVSQLEFIQQYEFLNHIECIANHVFRTSALKNAGGFVDFPLAWASDTATTFKIAKNGVANTSQILFNFRMSGLNISSNSDNQSVIRKKIDAIWKYYSYCANLLDTLKSNSIYEHNLKKELFAYNNKHVSSALMCYSLSLPFNDFLSCVKSLYRRNLFENKYQLYTLLKKWIRKRIRQ